MGNGKQQKQEIIKASIEMTKDVHFKMQQYKLDQLRHGERVTTNDVIDRALKEFFAA